MKKGSKKEASEAVRLRSFFHSALAVRAARPLSTRARMALHTNSGSWLFRRDEDGNHLEECETGADADVHFWLPPKVVDYLVECAAAKDASIGTMGIAVLQRLLAGEPGDRIRFRVDSGFLGLWSKGYFSVLSSGGPEVARHLAAKGFGGISAIKAAINGIRGKHAGG